MPTRRQHRINDLLREELSLLLPGRVDDPRLIGVVVTRVESTQDLATAKVYVTNYGSDEESKDMLAALEHARGFLRGELALVGLRRLPELVFARDKQFESGERVLEILRHLPPAGEGGEPAEDAGDDPAGDEGDDPGEVTAEGPADDDA